MNHIEREWRDTQISIRWCGGIFTLYFLICLLPILGTRFSSQIIPYFGRSLEISPRVYAALKLLALGFFLVSVLIVLWHAATRKKLRIGQLLAVLCVGYFYFGSVLLLRSACEYRMHLASVKNERVKLWQAAGRMHMFQMGGRNDYFDQLKVKEKHWKTFHEFFHFAEAAFVRDRLDFVKAWKIDDDDDTLRAQFYLNLVSSLWHYGNKSDPDRTGCVNQNETTGHKIQDGWTNVNTYLASEVACCSDYAYTLKAMFDHAHIVSRLIVLDGHVLNEVQLHGQWRALDPTIRVFYHHPWADIASGTLDKIKLTTFVHRDINTYDDTKYRELTSSMRVFMFNMISFRVHIPYRYESVIPEFLTAL